MAKDYFVNGSPEFLRVYQNLAPTSQLKKDIDEAMDELKLDPLKGDRIEKNLAQEVHKGTSN